MRTYLICTFAANHSIMHENNRLVFTILFVSCTFAISAQDMKEAFRERIRQFEVPQDIKHSESGVPKPEQLSIKKDEVLKVSPTTRLPTKGDYILTLNPPEKYKVNVTIKNANSSPLDQYPRGAVKYVFDGRSMRMESVGGTRPRGATFDLGPIRKRHKKNSNILKMLEK